MRKFWAIVYSMVDNSDVALQVVDARFPSICRTNQLEKYVQSHEKCNLLVALNKVDLILRDEQDKWIEWFKQQEIDAVGISAKLRLGTVKIRKKMLMASKKKTALVSVVGLPNTGKSSVINTLRGKHVATVASTPGQTKGEQKVKISNSLRMFDTPGVIPVKLPELHKILLGLTPITKIENIEVAAIQFYKLAEKLSPGVISQYYKIENEADTVLENIARVRNKILKKKRPDTFEAARILLKDHGIGRFIIKENITNPLRLQS